MSTIFVVIFYEHLKLHVIITFGGMILVEKTTFGERLKQLRQELNLTQEALAEKLQTVRSTINKYEKNTRKPEYETLIKIADLFNTTTDYLLGRTDKR
jgi:DNA-binding XRE family transcriptional regulator